MVEVTKMFLQCILHILRACIIPTLRVYQLSAFSMTFEENCELRISAWPNWKLQLNLKLKS